MRAALDLLDDVVPDAVLIAGVSEPGGGGSVIMRVSTTGSRSGRSSRSPTYL
ncbi:hypothetical protein ACIBP6_09895 [Nonomuraea terrae]|uniref:hypothetical protein n=1 Tax=Nonomuraea terrae TaxID=2530383 RepID=UPI003794886B